MLSDKYLREVIATAEQQTLSLEQRVVKLLHERGDMAAFNCDGQREIETRVRELLTEVF